MRRRDFFSPTSRGPSRDWPLWDPPFLRRSGVGDGGDEERLSDETKRDHEPYESCPREQRQCGDKECGLVPSKPTLHPRRRSKFSVSRAMHIQHLTSLRTDVALHPKPTVNLRIILKRLKFD